MSAVGQRSAPLERFRLDWARCLAAATIWSAVTCHQSRAALNGTGALDALPAFDGDKSPAESADKSAHSKVVAALPRWDLPLQPTQDQGRSSAIPWPLATNWPFSIEAAKARQPGRRQPMKLQLSGPNVSSAVENASVSVASGKATAARRAEFVGWPVLGSMTCP